MNVAVIPARGGSKRIPRKNIRAFAGKPMIAHSITCAVGSGLFERVIVSTDDDEIAEVAARYGAEIPFRRPRELSDDHTGLTDVVAHATKWLQDQGAAPNAVCCMLATAPFVRREDLESGLTVLQGGSWRYVFAAATFASPIFRSFRKRDDGGLEMFFPQHFTTRSQDLPEGLHDAAQFYWGLPGAWVEGAKIFDKESTVVMIPRWRVQDIDSEEDWARAEIMDRFLKSADSHASPVLKQS